MKSNATKFSALAFAVTLLAGVSATAQGMSYSAYQTGKSKIQADYKVDKKACASLAGNAKDICVEQAKGKEDVSQAELYESYNPNPKSHYKARIARAQAIYQVAKEICDDTTGNIEDVCRKEAKAALTFAEANATVEMKTQLANEAANAKSVAAQNQAIEKTIEVRSDATADKRAAQLAVEKEKCDAFASTAKDDCLKSAQAQFGKL